jgi:hypothetical protein
LFSHQFIVCCLNPAMGNPTRSGDRDDRCSSIMRIGRPFDVPLGLKGLHLSGERRWVSPHCIGEIAHTHRTVVDHLAQNSNGCHTNCDARTNRNQSIKTLAPCDAT